MRQIAVESACVDWGATSEYVSTTKSALLCIVYYLALSVAYVFEIQPKWDVMGFQSDVSYLFIAFSVALIPVYFLLISQRTPFNRLCLIFIFLTIYVPALSYISFANPSWYLMLAFLISIPPLLFFSSIKIPPIKAATFSVRVYVGILMLAIYAATAALVIRTGVANVSLDLYGAYEFRRGAFLSIGEGLNRTLSIITTFFLPLLIIYSISLKSRLRLIVLLFALLSAIVIFGYWQHKSALFLPIAAFSLYFFLKSGHPEYRLLYVFLLLSLILALEAILYVVSNNPEPAVLNGLIGRRALFVPPMLADLHIDFFTQNPKFFWQGLTDGFTGTSPIYDTSAAFLIGRFYFGDDNMSANVGLVGAGYAEAGLFGIVLYSSILGIIFAYLSSQARRLGHVFVFSVMAFVVHTAFASSDLLTTLLSHGLLFALVTLPFLASPDREAGG